MNRVVWTRLSARRMRPGCPGRQYFAGTHLNPKVTWWIKSAPFFGYIDRCQFLLQQGLFVPTPVIIRRPRPNFSQLKNPTPLYVLPGYDYNVITAEALIERASVRDGKIVLPDGMSYRVLVLPDREAIAVPVLKKIQDLVRAGATVIGPKPMRAETLENGSGGDTEVRRIGGELWDKKKLKGRVITGLTARQVL